MLERLDVWHRLAPDDAAADEQGVRWSVADLLRHSAHVARWLRTEGVVAGDRVAWHGGSSLDFAAVLLAAWQLDATYMGINPRYTQTEVASMLTRARPRVIVDASMMRRWLAVPHSDETPLPTPSGEQPAILVFTTGSTGHPKGALISHRAIAAASANQALHTSFGARCVINALPANHIGGIVNITTSAWWAAQSVAFISQFSPDAIAERLREGGRCQLSAVPMIFRRCLDAPGFAESARGRLVHALSGGAPLPRAVHDELVALGAQVQGMYGQTEMSGSICFTSLDDDAETTASTIGRPVAGLDFRLGPLDGSAGDLPEGELQVRGPQLFDAYLDDEAATRAAYTTDGWLRSGDLAVRRDDSSIQLTGRLKEIINSGGYKVMPAEIESVLLAHSRVAAAAVVGQVDAMFGEVVTAFVTARDPAPLQIAELDAWCRARLANYKVPKTFVQLEALPLLGVGKVDKRALATRPLEAPHV